MGRHLGDDVRVIVVRHACAGRKGSWSGPDDARPLDPAGVAQAEALAGLLEREPIDRLVSSPTRRCIQTLEPLADRLGLPIETNAALAADADPDDALRALRDGDVASTHGEVMRPLLAAIRAAGARIDAARSDDDWLLLKGSAWVLTIDEGGTVSALRHLAPAPRTECPQHPATMRDS